MLPEKYRETRHLHVENLWKVWRGLGVFSEGPQLKTGIEEALIGLCVFGRHDQRLFDEALSLLVTYHGLINKNKTRYFIQKADPDSSGVFAVIAHVIASRSGDRRLESIQLRGPTSVRRMKSPFFVSLDHKPQPIGKETDPVFLKYGWKRNIFRISKTIPGLGVMAQHNPWIKGKLLFGNAVRVDVIMDLMANDTCTAPDLARKNGHTQKSVWNVFSDFTAAGITEATRVQNKIFYQLTKNGRSLFAQLRPDRPASLWQEWIRTGHYIYHLNKLPENASSLLLESEEKRIMKLLLW